MNKPLDLPDKKLSQKEVTLHKKILKEALLREYNGTTQKISFLKGGEQFIKHKIFTFTTAGFLIILILVGITYFTTNSPVLTQRAEAREAVDKAYDRVIKLSPNERKELKEKLKADLEDSLTEAKNANDLEIVPEDQIQRISPPPKIEGNEKAGFVFEKKENIKKDGNMIIENGRHGERVLSGDEKILAPKGLKILRYTNPDGAKVILGINENDEPVMKMIKLENFDPESAEGANQKFFFHEKL